MFKIQRVSWEYDAEHMPIGEVLGILFHCLTCDVPVPNGNSDDHVEAVCSAFAQGGVEYTRFTDHALLGGNVSRVNLLVQEPEETVHYVFSVVGRVGGATAKLALVTECPSLYGDTNGGHTTTRFDTVATWEVEADVLEELFSIDEEEI